MANPDHADLAFATEYSHRSILKEVDDSTGVPVVLAEVTVNSITTRQGEFTVTISRDTTLANQKPYSLYNLGIQGRNWPVTLAHLKKDQVTVEVQRWDGTKFVPFAPTTSTSDVDIWSIPETNAGGDPTDIGSPYYKAAIDSAILFLSFSGPKCTLNAYATKPVVDNGKRIPLPGARNPSFDSHDGFPGDGSSGGE